MRKLVLIAGLPRSGSTLLCNLLNMREGFHATPTSGLIGSLQNLRSAFSNSQLWKAQNRLNLMDDYRRGMHGFIEGFYHDKDVVFDKNRGWVNSNNLRMLDELFPDTEMKILYTYRKPVHVINSIEKKYTKHALLGNTDEIEQPHQFATHRARMYHFSSPDYIVGQSANWLTDSIDQGYDHRIKVVNYESLCKDVQSVMDSIHVFIGEDKHTYDLSELKQTTFEEDGFYNYKFPHSITEGEVVHEDKPVGLKGKYIELIEERFSEFDRYIKKLD